MNKRVTTSMMLTSKGTLTPLGRAIGRSLTIMAAGR
jgi:hypothetical protein